MVMARAFCWPGKLHMCDFAAGMDGAGIFKWVLLLGKQSAPNAFFQEFLLKITITLL